MNARRKADMREHCRDFSEPAPSSLLSEALDELEREEARRRDLRAALTHLEGAVTLSWNNMGGAELLETALGLARAVLAEEKRLGR